MTASHTRPHPPEDAPEQPPETAPEDAPESTPQAAAENRADAPLPRPVGVILVDHGSRRAASNELLHQVAARLAEQTGWPIVQPAHMELADPTIAQAFDAAVAAGARSIVVLPYFLGPGRHWDQDIPELTRQAAQHHPDIPWRLAPPIGLHDGMAAILMERYREAMRLSD